MPSRLPPLGLAFIVFFLANLALFGLISLHRQLLEILWLLTNRPWGIVTSVFVHADLGHLAGNLAFFSLYAVLFVGVGWYQDAKTRSYMSKVFLWLIFLSAFAANAIQYLAWQAGGITKNSWDASGVVYASAGVLFAAVLWSTPLCFRGLKSSLRGKRGIARPRRGVAKVALVLVMRALPLVVVI